MLLALAVLHLYERPVRRFVSERLAGKTHSSAGH